ncbi:MAG: 6-phosphogluconolactonase [Kiritimatiellia bacterium]|nr:6-phosphogluconolactonase [Lentisphaerota bacterium]
MRELMAVHFDSAARLADAVANMLWRHLKMSAPRAHAVMLTGGRTVVRAYRKAGGLHPTPLCRNLRLLLSDERLVPRDSDQSNFHTVQPLLQTLALPEDQMILPEPVPDPAMAARAYHLQLDAFIRAGGRITLGLLGIGTDGHVASLFTAEDLARAEGEWAVGVPRPDPPARVSVSPALLARVELLVVLAVGPAKRVVIDRLVNADDRLPAVRALAGVPQVLVWLADRE